MIRWLGLALVVALGVVACSSGGALRVAPAVHPDGTLIVVANRDGLALWSLDPVTGIARWDRPAAVRALAFDDSGQRLAIGAASGTATVWDLTRDTQISVTPHPHAPIERLAFAPDGTLATGSTIQLASVQRPSIDLVAVWSREGTQVWSHELEQLEWLAYRPGSNLLATASVVAGDDQAVTLWTATGAPEAVTARGSAPPLAWSADGSLAYAVDGPPAIAIATATELATGQVAAGSTLGVAGTQLAFQPGGKLLAVGEDSGRLSVWTADDRQPVSVGEDESGEATALAWNHDGSLFATAATTTVRLWEPRVARQLATFAAHAPVTAIAFHPGGRLVAVGCDDGVIELWAVATATVVATLAVLDADRVIVRTPDGAIDGALAATAPMLFTAGDPALPRLDAWEHVRTPGLLAARLAALPTETAPRADLGTAPRAPPTCFTESPGLDRKLTTHAVAGDTLALCVASAPHRPICFDLDLASGIYHARASSPYEQLGRPAPRPATVTVHRNGTQVEVCRAGACRTVAVPEATNADLQFAANVDASLIAGWVRRWGKREAAVVYDVASGRRRARISTDRMFGTNAFGMLDIEFITATTLLVSNTPCAGPCSTSLLVDARTGKLLGPVGGRGDAALNSSALYPAQLAGDVFAFNDWDSPRIVYQNVRTGAIVRELDRPLDCAGEDCDLVMEHVGLGIALLPRTSRAGDVTLIDANGALLAQHHLPICK